MQGSVEKAQYIKNENFVFRVGVWHVKPLRVSNG
jgi:hypothetical protein